MNTETAAVHKKRLCGADCQSQAAVLAVPPVPYVRNGIF